MIETAPIVLIEDDAGHARLIEKNFRRSGVVNPFARFADGTSALQYLLGGPRDGNPKPTLILLDLNLPDMKGIDILRSIKAHSLLRLTPVFVLTTTDDKLEIQRCYDLGCNAYVTKPIGDQSFAHAIQQLGQFLTVIQIPDSLSA